MIYLDVRPSGYASLSEAAMCGELGGAAARRAGTAAPSEPDDGQLPVTEAS